MIRRVSEGLWELLYCAGFGVFWLFIAAVLVLIAGMPLWIILSIIWACRC